MKCGNTQPLPVGLPQQVPRRLGRLAAALAMEFWPYHIVRRLRRYRWFAHRIGLLFPDTSPSYHSLPESRAFSVRKLVVSDWRIVENGCGKKRCAGQHTAISGQKSRKRRGKSSQTSANLPDTWTAFPNPPIKGASQYRPVMVYYWR